MERVIAEKLAAAEEEAPLQPANNLPAAKKRGRPAGSKNAPKELAPAAADNTLPTSAAVPLEDLVRQLEARNANQAALIKQLEEDKAALMGGVPAAVRSTWTLGDLGRLSDELASHGISISFSFEKK